MRKIGRVILNTFIDLLKISLLSLVIAVPIYFLAHLLDIPILKWRDYEIYNGEEYVTRSSAIPLIIGSFLSIRILSKYGKLSYKKK
jgi:membrane protein CcdC involved in cytochrome C biogenesis